MGRIEIIEKLNSFLDKHMPFTEECHVIYLHVEIRKVLDHDNNRKYPLLRFYSDWSVHTEKDHITKEMHDMMVEIYNDVVDQIDRYPRPAIKRTKVISFMYMEDLQVEMTKFLQKYHLPISLTEKSNWLEFVKLFVKILADQPINNPSIDIKHDIKQFAFLPAASGCVLGRIDFNQNIGKYPYYEFGNAY